MEWSCPVKSCPAVWQFKLSKLARAFHPLETWQVKLSIMNDKYTLSFRLNQSHSFMVCVPLPCLLLKGPVQWDLNNYSMTCKHFIVHTCVNSSVVLNIISESLNILRARPAVWISAKLSCPRLDSCDDLGTESHWKDIKKRTCWMVEFIITVIKRIIALTHQQQLEWLFIKKLKLLQLVETGINTLVWTK